jgi:hypothetical protein
MNLEIQRSTRTAEETAFAPGALTSPRWPSPNTETAEQGVAARCRESGRTIVSCR